MSFSSPQQLRLALDELPQSKGRDAQSKPPAWFVFCALRQHREVWYLRGYCDEEHVARFEHEVAGVASPDVGSEVHEKQRTSIYHREDP